MTRGTPKIYLKTAESGRKRAHGFCETCGARLYSASVGDEVTQYNIRVPTLTQRRELTPKGQIWTRSALPWIEALGGMKKTEKQ